MYCVRNIKDDIYWVGASDRKLSLFENVFPVPRGVSYNSYLITDEKTVLLDTVDSSVSSRFFENIEYVLSGRSLDYLIVNHMEPDHCATIGEVVRRYPDVKIVGNAKTVTMIKQFFSFDIDNRALIVKEGDTLETGNHTLTFVMAPMVHWPEVMVTYDTKDKILFSADAFGTFGALSGNIFADELNFNEEWLEDARIYYTNIVGKYGTQVQTLLKKAQNIDIEIICPLHGPIWRSNASFFIDKYNTWSRYQPEEKAVMIAYASVYGNTQNACDILASELASLGVKNIVMYDVSHTHPSTIVAQAFRCSHIVFASTTYNAGIFCNMETVLADIKAHNLQNRNVAIIENGSWAPTSGSLMSEHISSMKNMNIIAPPVTIRSSVKEEQHEALRALAKEIFKSLNPTQSAEASHEQKIEPDAMFKLSYGLFVLSAQENGKDNACIINTVTQVTDSPKRISIAVNKANYTHDMIKKTGKFNVSVLTESTPFRIFEHYGFASGRDTDKFADAANIARSDNGIIYLNEFSNAYISAEVIEEEDFETHTVFTALVTEAKLLSSEPSVTYDYYFKNIKPKPAPIDENVKGFVCKICGFVYEGDTLPPDYVCPLCKHGAQDFEPLK